MVDLASSNLAACAFDSHLPHSIPGGLLASRPDSGSGARWFDSSPGSHASVAQQIERRPRKTQAAGSSPAEGSLVLVPNGRSHDVEDVGSGGSNPPEDTGSAASRGRLVLGARSDCASNLGAEHAIGKASVGVTVPPA